MADASAKVPELREAFLKKYDGSVLDDTYDSRDVDQVKNNDGFLRSVLNAFKTKGDVGKSVDVLNDILLFRAKLKLNDLTEGSLHPELVEKKGVYYHGTDKDGRKILHFRVSKQKKGHLIEEGRSYLAYHMWQHYKDHPEEPLVFFFDFVDAGVSNMDMDITKYIIKCASTYFPCISAFNLMFKMNVGLEAIWKIIQTFLDADQKKKTYYCKRTNISQYINADQLLPHMIKEK